MISLQDHIPPNEALKTMSSMADILDSVNNKSWIVVNDLGG